MKKIVLAAFIAAVSATPALAAGNTDTEQGVAQATVVAPIVLTHTTGAVLEFGRFTSDAGTVTVTTVGGRTASGPVLLTGTTASADAFTVEGDANRGYDIVTAAGTVAETGGTTMAFTTTAAASGTLSGLGACRLRGRWDADRSGRRACRRLHRQLRRDGYLPVSVTALRAKETGRCPCDGGRFSVWAPGN